MALVLIGGLLAAAQLCFVNTMARDDAGFALPFLYATLIFAVLYDSIFLISSGQCVGTWRWDYSSGGALLAWRGVKLCVKRQ